MAWQCALQPGEALRTSQSTNTGTPSAPGHTQDMGEQLHALLHYPEQDQLVSITTVGTLLLLGRDAPASVKPAGSTSKGQWSTLLRTKLPSSSSNGEAAPSVTWAGPHTIASAGDRDTVLRLYNFETEDNYTLALDASTATAAGSSSGRYSDDVASGPTSGVACLAYDAKHQLLAAGTLSGRVVAYRQRPAASFGDEGLVELSKTWEAQPSFQVSVVHCGAWQSRCSQLCQASMIGPCLLASP